MNPIARNPMSFPVIKADIIIEAPIIISNVIIIALSKVFFFISHFLSTSLLERQHRTRHLSLSFQVHQM